MAMTELPEKPEKPLDSDCCGNGCVPCVLDVYAEELAIWEKECARLKAGLTLTPADPGQGAEENYESPVLCTEAYCQYQVIDITQETHDTWRFTCRLGTGQSLGLLPGQHIVIRGHVSGRPITRQYTPVSDVTMKGSFQLLIKVYREGRMSEVVRCWQVGDWLEVRGPYGSLKYTPNQYRRVVMLAAGTGVAPMAQLIQAMLSNEKEEGRIRLLYACRTEADLLMRREISEWRHFWNFSVLFVFSQECPSSSSNRHCVPGEQVLYGRMNRTVVEKELGHSYTGTRLLVCGTRSFDTDMLQLLDDCRFPKDQVLRF